MDLKHFTELTEEEQENISGGAIISSFFQGILTSIGSLLSGVLSGNPVSGVTGFLSNIFNTLTGFLSNLL